MRPIGSECSLALEVDGAIVALPFTEETLRGQPVAEEREPLLGVAAPAYEKVRYAATTGCVVTRVGRASLPALLLVCLGEANGGVHVVETRGMFSTVFQLSEEPEGLPSFDVVVDRGVEKLCYPDLRARGFELRGRCAQALYLRLDVSGGEAAPSFEEMPGLVDEEYFFFEADSVVVDGVSMDGVYELALAVDTGLERYSSGGTRNGKKSVAFTMHTPLDSVVAGALGRESHTVELAFRLANTFPEPNQAPSFSVRCEDMVLRKEQKEPDSPDEMCSPYLFMGRGEVSATVVCEEAAP